MYGREYIRIAVEKTAVRAWQYYRSLRRAHVNGGAEKDLYGGYFSEVRQYLAR